MKARYFVAITMTRDDERCFSIWKFSDNRTEYRSPFLSHSWIASIDFRTLAELEASPNLKEVSVEELALLF